MHELVEAIRAASSSRAADDHYLAQGSLDARWYVSSRFGIGARYDYAYRQSTPSDPAVGPVTSIKVPQARLFISTAIPRWSTID